MAYNRKLNLYVTFSVLFSGTFTSAYYQLLGGLKYKPEATKKMSASVLKDRLIAYCNGLRAMPTVNWWNTAQWLLACNKADPSRPIHDPVITREELANKLGIDYLTNIPDDQREKVLSSKNINRAIQYGKWPSKDNQFATTVSWFYLKHTCPNYTYQTLDDALHDGLDPPTNILVPCWAPPNRSKSGKETKNAEEFRQMDNAPSDAEATMVWAAVHLGCRPGESIGTEVYWNSACNRLTTAAQDAARRTASRTIIGEFAGAVPLYFFNSGYYPFHNTDYLVSTLSNTKWGTLAAFDKLLIKCCKCLLPTLLNPSFFHSSIEVKTATGACLQYIAALVRLLGQAFDLQEGGRMFMFHQQLALEIPVHIAEKILSAGEDTEVEVEDDETGQSAEVTQQLTAIIENSVAVQSAVRLLRYYKIFKGLNKLQLSALKTCAADVITYLQNEDNSITLFFLNSFQGLCDKIEDDVVQDYAIL